MMSDTIDDALDNDEAEEEADELTNQVGSSLQSVIHFSLMMTFFVDSVMQQL